MQNGFLRHQILKKLFYTMQWQPASYSVIILVYQFDIFTTVPIPPVFVILEELKRENLEE